MPREPIPGRMLETRAPPNPCQGILRRGEDRGMDGGEDGRKEREGERGCFKGGGDGSMDRIHPLLKNEMVAIRSVSRGFASIGRAQNRRRLW